MSKKWTADEINLLDSNLTSKEIAEAINRTVSAVRMKRYYVNLSEQKRREKQECMSYKRHTGAFLESNRKANLKYYNPTRNAINNGKPYTTEEDKLILSKDMPEEIIAEKLNRSLGAIQLRRHYLKTGQRKSELDEVTLIKLISNL